MSSGRAFSAYTSLCRSLKYLLKISYFIQDYPKVAGIRFLRLFVLAGWKHVLCLKKYHKNERHLWLVSHVLTKLWQNVCPINMHILIYWYARCNCKLWKVPWFYRVFWVFSYIIDKHSLLYHHQTFTDCVFNQCTHFGLSTWQMWLQVMEGSLIQLRFLGILVNYSMFDML